MVKNTPKKISRSGKYSYEQADDTINRATHLLLARWEKPYKAARSKRKFLAKRLYVLADYIDWVFDDCYLRNLYFQYAGGFLADDSLEEALYEMESTRRIIVRALKSPSKKIAPDIKTQHVYNGQKKVKWKFLIRLLTAQHTAQLLYQQYQRQCRLTKVNVPQREIISGTLPGMTAWYIRELVEYK